MAFDDAIDSPKALFIMKQADCKALFPSLNLDYVDLLKDAPRTDLTTYADWTNTQKHTEVKERDLKHLRYYAIVSLRAGSPLGFGGIALGDGWQQLDRAVMDSLTRGGFVYCDDARKIFSLTSRGITALRL